MSCSPAYYYSRCFCFVLLFLIGSLAAEIRINEFMAANTRAFPDITDFEDYPDWIELYNDSSEEVSLADYSLSDDPDEPLKWHFSDDATIPANGYLVVIADGNDAFLGERPRRTAWPFRSYTLEKHHTNFKLSSSGEALVLSKAPGAEEVLSPFAANWSYNDTGNDLGTTWRDVSFVNSWPVGQAPLGYGDPVNTVISFGNDTNDRHVTSYYRKTFQADQVDRFTQLIFLLLADDAAAIYLNGTEVARHNLPDGVIDFETFAVNAVLPAEENNVTTFRISPDLLVEGENVLAVELHQIARTSVDARFELQLNGISRSNPTIIDSHLFEQQIDDVSRGRSPLDSNVWVNFAESTPGTANGGAEVTDLRSTSDTVQISPAGGVQNGPVMVTLTCSEGAIHYTLDGSNPTTADPLYTGPFEVTELTPTLEPAQCAELGDIPSPMATVVRAKCFAPGKVPGAIATRTYLVDQSFNGLPYLSLTADPETLFGDDIGIYCNDHEPVQGVGRAVYKGKDAPGHLEFFPTDGSEGFAVNGGFRMGGENNWASHFQRAFNFALRGRYGDDALNYDLFPGSPISSFTSLTIREGGDDWGKGHLTDALFDSIAKDRLEVETTKSRPTVLLVNGRYWGLYNLRDRWDENWFFQHFGTNDGEYDHLSYTNTSRPPNTENGSTDEWDALLIEIDNSDLTDPAVWESLSERIDMISLADFAITESYGRNTSWSGNREHWKDRAPGSKWRWFVPDMDRTFGSTGGNSRLGDILNGENTLRRMINSPQFKALLAQRAAAHITTTFSRDRVVGIIDGFVNLMEPEMGRQINRWPRPGAETFSDSIERMRNFAADREAGFVEEYREVLALDTEVQLTLSTFGQGSFRLAGVEIPSGTLEVFPNLETSLEAIPAPGYRFAGWIGVDSDASSITVNLPGDTILIANFTPDSSTGLSGLIPGSVILNPNQSPYIITDDLIVPSGSSLTIPAGVDLEFENDRNLRVMGTLIVNGTEESPVNFKGRHGTSWGGLSFENTTTPSSLSHLVVRDATRGHAPLTYPAAISGLNAELTIDFLDISDGRAPLFFRGGSLILRDSLIHIPITGDGLNVKQGQAQTIRCTFLGNSAPDTDAIDYDGVINGLISDCRIYRFFGFNSDGIDTGEQCVNVLIEKNKIFFNSDKGISVGQGSSVIARNNLIVGCPQGVGVKDVGSFISIDQNTFVDCAESVAVFEKNFGNGGGSAIVTNTIFSGSAKPINVDNLSNLTVNYSLSDTAALPGNFNFQDDIRFTDPTILDFSLTPSSIAVDSGDPGHALDPDGTRADRGALYQYNPDDYPFLVDRSIVINEVLANSGESDDWVELYNNSSADIDISGWFLSDDGSNLLKYRIPEGTILSGQSYLTFFEDIHFGEESSDPNRLVSFSLSDAGETVHLSSATADTITDYRSKQKFRASLEGLTLGLYRKSSSDDVDFVTLRDATLSKPNSGPVIGPIVISEIMYDPASSSASEYLELLNISSDPVEFFDTSRDAPWLLTDGIEFELPAITIAPGERILLAEDLAKMNIYGVSETTRIYQWTSGKLSNSGEDIELSRPGPLNDEGTREYVLVDRVNYKSEAPWPVIPDGQTLSLSRISERDYGNDLANWRAVAPSPGAITAGSSYTTWAAAYGNIEQDSDEDRDGRSNLLEYSIGSNPLIADFDSPLNVTIGSNTSLAYRANITRTDIDIEVQGSPNLNDWAPISIPPSPISGEEQLREITFPRTSAESYYRLFVRKKP